MISRILPLPRPRRSLHIAEFARPGSHAPVSTLHYSSRISDASSRRSDAALESLPLALLLWLACVILLAGLLQGALGFGFPFVATPLVAMVTDMRTAIIIVLLPTVATICVALFASGPLRATLARFWMMPLYMILGSAAGTWVFVSAPDAPYTLVLALLTLFYLNLDRLGRTEWPLVR